MNPAKKMVYMQRVLNPRTTKTSADIERENFERTMFESLNKAINPVECPPKEKHVRKLLIGTYQVKSGLFFWEMSPVLKLQENPIICWKFCQVLHKLLRDGYRQVVADSYSHRQVLVDCGKMWSHMDGYGQIIKKFCQLLFNRINFYIRNPRFPTDLKLTDDEIEAIGERDVNVYFQLACELFDSLDDILSLQENVLGSLKLKSSSSLTQTGQCRLAPLTACIQDSSLLYDYSVKILFRLHAQLPVATLEGHRERFMNQYNALKQFYLNTGSLQYFKNLIQIPRLTDKPPNFLIASDINDHVTPHVVVIEERDSPELNNPDELLIDISSQEDEIQAGESSNTSLTGVVVNKDQLINQLRSNIDQLNTEIQFAKFEQARIVNNLSSTIEELKIKLEQSQNIDSKSSSGIPNIVSIETDNKLAELAKELNDLKVTYNKLYQDHLELKKNSELNQKSIKEYVANIELASKEKTTLHSQVKLLENKISEMATSANIQECSKTEVRNLTAKFELKDTELTKLKSLYDQLKTQNSKQAAEFEINSKRNLKDCENNALSTVLKSETSLLEDLASKSNQAICEVGTANLNHFLAIINDTERNLKNLHGEIKQPTQSNDKIEAQIDSIIKFFTLVGHLYFRALVTYETRLDADVSQEIMTNAQALIDNSLALARNLPSFAEKSETTSRPFNLLSNNLDKLKALITSCIQSECKPENLEELLTKELNETDKIIKEAALRIEQLTVNSRKLDTGIKLQVNSKISDVCSNLMQAVMNLILMSKNLQKEIVRAGNSSAQNVQEFYQRNSSWTEGLISAANVVAMAAKLLVDSADKIMTGDGKFTELAAAAHEIAAATTQLVVASKVKAKQDSESLKSLVLSSKQVNLATGNVVATAKVCAQLVEQESENLDISTLSLHQTKKLEMETQVKLLELESEITRERIKLGALRKQHYDIQPE